MLETFSLQPLEFDKIRNILLGYVITDMAGERVEALVPMRDRPLIERRLDELVEMTDLLQFDDAFPIDTIRDIRPLLAKIHSLGTFLNPDALLQVKLALETGRRIRSYIKQRSEKYPLLLRITELLHTFPDIEEAIDRAVDDNGAVKDSASPKLRQIRRDKDAKSNQLRKKLETLARQFAAEGYAPEAMVTVRDGRMVIPVKDEFKNTVRGFIHDESASGQTVFIEPAEGLELNNEMRKLVLDEIREVERILTEIADRIRSHRETLLSDLEILSDVEFLYVKGRFSQAIQALRPEINSEGVIQVKNGLHPLLLYKENNKLPAQRKPVVPLNMEIGGEYRTLIISGPNAGGKTVALKTIGLFVVMVQSGLLIPSGHGTRIGVFEQVFADIGDDQSIENDLSTFSSHAKNLSEMVERVDLQTLILIDEMGSGTDPKEGSSLAIAILEHFNAQKAVSIVTTHHGELKAFAHNTPGVENGSMEFDQETLEPTYRFRSRIPGSSYAFEISKRMGLDSAIIRRARELSGGETQRLENLIQDLQTRSKKYDEGLADLSREKSGLEGMAKFYSDRTNELRQKEKDVKKLALEEKQRALAEANKKIEAAVQEIKKAQADIESVKKAREAILKERAATDEELTEIRDTPDETELISVTKGERVFIKHMDLEGTVLEIPEGSTQAVVGVGAIKIRIDIRQLAKSQHTEAPHPVVKETVKWDTDDIGQEIDLRGLTTEEALYEVDKYLTDAQVLGFHQVTLLHGKGGGILRNRITEVLKRDRRVASFRLGEYGEGDTGVTVVELK